MTSFTFLPMPIMAVGASPSSARTVRCRQISYAGNMGGTMLNVVPVAPPNRSTQAYAVRAEDQSNFLDNIKEQADKVGKNVKDAFGDAQQKADEAASRSKQEVSKASEKAKSSSGNLGGDAANLKDDVQSRAEEAGEKLKAGIEDLQTKLGDAANSAKGSVEDVKNK